MFLFVKIFFYESQYCFKVFLIYILLMFFSLNNLFWKVYKRSLSSLHTFPGVLREEKRMAVCFRHCRINKFHGGKYGKCTQVDVIDSFISLITPLKPHLLNCPSKTFVLSLQLNLINVCHIPKFGATVPQILLRVFCNIVSSLINLSIINSGGI